MLDQKFLNKWVPLIVPSKYGPNKDPESGKPLLGVYVVASDKLAFTKDVWFKDAPKDSRVLGHLINIGAMMESLGKKRDNLSGKFIIRLNESQSVNSGIYSLAHELGHLVGTTEEYDLHKQDEEKYATDYSIRRIEEAVDDYSLRMKIYASAITQERV
jgi:hypothetical protein